MINPEKKYSKLIIRLTVIAIFFFFVGYHIMIRTQEGLFLDY